MAFDPEARGLYVKLNAFSSTHPRKSTTELELERKAAVCPLS